MRCWSCQRQLFQSESETLLQKPRPAEWNCLRESKRLRDGGSLPLSDKVSLCIVALKFVQPRGLQGKRTIGSNEKVSSEGKKKGSRSDLNCCRLDSYAV